MLRSYSLIIMSTRSDVLEMHRLVQFATRRWLEQNNKLEEWKEKYIATMAETFPVGRYENWERCQVLFPHAELALGY